MERGVEREHVPLAREAGVAVTPWSPLASGLLAGKYQREDGQVVGSGRLQAAKRSGNPVFEKFTERNLGNVDVVREVTRSPAEIALAPWPG